MAKAKARRKVLMLVVYFDCFNYAQRDHQKMAIPIGFKLILQTKMFAKMAQEIPIGFKLIIQTKMFAKKAQRNYRIVQLKLQVINWLIITE